MDNLGRDVRTMIYLLSGCALVVGVALGWVLGLVWRYFRG